MNTKHKTKLIEIQSILTEDQRSKRSPMARQLSKLVKANAAFQLALSLSEHSTAFKIAKDLSRSATRYRFPEFAISASEYLFMHYSVFNYNRNKAIHYKQRLETSLEEFSLEIEMKKRTTYTTLQSRSSHYRKHSKQNMKETWEFGKKRIGKINSLSFHRMAFYSGCRYYNYLQDWDNLSRICEDAITYFKGYELKSKVTLSLFYRFLVESKYATSSLITDGIFIQQCNDIFSKGTNRINFRFLLVRNYIKIMDYKNARIEMDTTTKSTDFKIIPDHNKWSWSITQAYLEFAEESNNLNAQKKRIKISKFINSTDNYQFTNNEQQLQMRIAQLLFFFLDKKWNRIEERTEALLKFTDRNKIKSISPRSYLFVRMIFQIPKHNFNSAAIKRHTSKFISRISRVNSSSSNLEIIPYEHLWEMIMENLKKKR